MTTTPLTGFLRSCCALALFAVSASARAQIEHPFLLATSDDFAEFYERARSDEAQNEDETDGLWSTMRKQAVLWSQEGRDPSVLGELDHKPLLLALTKHIDAVALAYIVDEPTERAFHTQRVREAIAGIDSADEYSLAALIANELVGGGGYTQDITGGNLLFHAIIALDVVYNDLTPEELASVHAVLAEGVSKISPTGAHTFARIGLHGTWDIFNGDRTTPDDPYFNRWMAFVGAEGVTHTSPGYAQARYNGSDRQVKALYNND